MGMGPLSDAPLGRRRPPPARLSHVRASCQSIQRVMSLAHRWYLLASHAVRCRVCGPSARSPAARDTFFGVSCACVCAGCSRLCRCHVRAVRMAENHLEYGYLEGRPRGDHFPERPVGIYETGPATFLHFFFFFFFLARTSVGRANHDDHVEQKQTKKKQKTSLCCVCSIAVSLMHAFCAEDDISEPYPGWHAASPGVTAHS